jgi:hypothetical protein
MDDRCSHAGENSILSGDELGSLEDEAQPASLTDNEIRCHNLVPTDTWI